MRCFKATLEYDGTDFAGFQLQTNLRTVQGACEEAIEKLVGVPIRVHGAGRTDAGVHALGQVIGFRAETNISLAQMPVAMNSQLPRDLSIKSVEEVDERFHARFSAKSRAYVYIVLRQPVRSALFRRYTYWCSNDLNVDDMRFAADSLIGSKDFTSFANSLSETATAIRNMKFIRVREHGPFLIFSVEANAFLRGMVRNLVGTLLEVGKGRLSPEEMHRIIDAKDRQSAGPSAPPEGLTLVRVRYNSVTTNVQMDEESPTGLSSDDIE
ncbi:MAG: tRNA pseudouridine(38-40) synthase TruA [Chthonomonadales bacterium]